MSGTPVEKSEPPNFPNHVHNIARSGSSRFPITSPSVISCELGAKAHRKSIKIKFAFYVKGLLLHWHVPSSDLAYEVILSVISTEWALFNVSRAGFLDVAVLPHVKIVEGPKSITARAPLATFWLHT